MTLKQQIERLERLYKKRDAEGVRMDEYRDMSGDIADLALPVPQTAVIAALGIIYGATLGGLLGSVGLITGGLLGYLLMRTSARTARE